jgi:hypothetical protein
MKIVEEKPFEYEFTCGRCKSSYIAEASDIRFGYFGGVGYAGERGTPRYYVFCLACGDTHFISLRHIPPKVQELAKEKGSK